MSIAVPIPVFKMITVGLLPSPLKVVWYRFRGARIGKRVSIGLLSIIDAETVEIGDDTRIGLLCFLTLKKALKLGKRIRIQSMVAVETGSLSVGDDSTIMEQVVIGGMLTPRSEISIGKRVKIFPNSFLNPTEPITIEDDVGIGGGSYIFTHGSWQNVLDGFPAAFAPVHIKRGAWLPWRVFVQPGVTIGERAIVGPSAVVAQSVPDLGVASGAPAEIRDMKGRHLRRMTLAHKEKMVAGIVDDYIAFQQYLGEKCQALTPESAMARTFNHNGKLVSFFAGSSLPAHINADILVSLQTISEERKSDLRKSGKSWFDLERKEALLDRRHAGAELKNYLSRYGIRFDLVE